MKTKSNTYKLTMTALMAAIICIASPISIPIPISEVPISLGTFAVYLAACILGRKYGTISVVVYLLVGFTGVPVFTGWTGGVSKLAGPTGGYLVGYLCITLIAGWFADRFEHNILMNIIGLVIGTMVCYFLGTAWMGYSLGITAKAAVYAGVLPYLPFDIIKIGAAGVLSCSIKTRIAKIQVS